MTWFKDFVEETLVLAAAKWCDQNTTLILLEASGQQLMRITAAKCESSQGYHALIIHSSLTTDSSHGCVCYVHTSLGNGQCFRTSSVVSGYTENGLLFGALVSLQPD